MTTLTDQTPYYSCVMCCGELSHPAEDLRVFYGELWCQRCWDDQERVFKRVEWSVLDPFIPAHEIRIRALEAEVERLERRIEAGRRVVSELEMQKIALNHRAEAAEAETDRLTLHLSDEMHHRQSAEAKLAAIERLQRYGIEGVREGSIRVEKFSNGQWIKAYDIRAELDREAT